jgi:imidazolonepropionase-like amidohydrolase/Tol biopolymer transport system component
MDLAGGERRILTALSSSRWDSGNDRFFACSPTKAEVVFIRDGKPMIISEAGGTNPVELNVEGAFPRGITDPVWAPGGSRLAFVAGPADYADHSGGRLWQVGADGGKAEPLSAAKTEVRAPGYSPDGLRMAYFVRTEDLAFEIWISDLEGNEPRKLAGHKDITPLRLRWTPEGKDLVYCAEGRFWKTSVEGGQSLEIPFTAHLSFPRNRTELRPVQFPKPRETRSARGQMGLAISPDGEKIAAIALGRLWVWEVGNRPAAVTRLPVSASGLCWSPDNTEVAWSAGVTGTEDLFATSVVSGLTRRLTALPGTEVRASWSPDGRSIAFVYRDSFELGARPKPTYESLRAIKVADASITDLAQTLRLQIYPAYGQSLTLSQGRYWGRPWSPDSAYLLSEIMGGPALVTMDGKVIPLKDSRGFPPYKPTLLWEAAGSILYTSNFLLWRAPFDTRVGMNGEPVPVSLDPALYPSVARDGSILYISDEGLRLRRPDGKVNRIGWPLSFETAAPPQSLLIRNVRIIPGTGAAMTEPRDILVEKGRISRIEARGRIRARRNITVLEGEGRTVIPGLIDAHVHVWDQALLSEFLYEGITTVREMGNPLAWAKGFQELVEAGIQSGPRIVLGGFLGDSQIHPWLADSPHVIGNPNGEDGAGRALSLARAFDVDFIKMYEPVNPSSGARFIRMAHERGFPVSSHAGYPLALVASGIDGKEHTISFLELGPRICGTLRDDIVQLTKESGMTIVPTLSLMTRQLAARDGSIVEQVKDSPFLSGLLALYGFTTRAPAFEKRLGAEIIAGRENAARFHRAGVPLAAGTDSPFYWMPWALHAELEELVASGLSPLEAITAASLNAARVLKAEKEVGTVEKGKLADIVILDADPTGDIRNTRKIWKIIRAGKVVDRNALQNWTKRENEEVATIGK